MPDSGMQLSRRGMPPTYDTPLSPAQAAQYAPWRQALPTQLQGTADYDLQGAFVGNAQESARGHLIDTWKKPNHMTFSDGSQYSTPQAPGGHWADAAPGFKGPEDQHPWVFWASPENLRQHPAVQLSDYMRRQEPSSSLVLPINYSLPARGL